ncbi:hypothetical protein K431DRAFT_289638 [Polychaeton citri CBS 116435]|uniref:Zn(2)-C6 fungal-type domain-containing protein n=1 Tax=Polychaeton citri CBS 116435 TaxID=1314669 RepID=A0A9P4PWE0_9PEZI|nr:hypothetical protein K431DRAFT_289638 [Polychaeton citri CBS 116435]
MDNKESGRPCHNCRRQRRKCDRTLPTCHKCLQRGQECLGYGNFLRWEQGLASRGRMTGKTFPAIVDKEVQEVALRPQLHQTLLEPLLQDIDVSSRLYLYHFATNVCQDLVLYDISYDNAFRNLIPLAQYHPSLLQIIIANSALHMSNSKRFQALSPHTAHDHGSNALTNFHGDDYRVALVAKQRALVMLNTALNNMGREDIDAILAMVLLFIEFELLDCGQKEWKHHIRGARTLIERISQTFGLSASNTTPLRRCLIANCMVFDIFGSAFTSLENVQSSNTISAGTFSLLQDEEGNHCSSFPVALLQLLQISTQLAQSNFSAPLTAYKANNERERALALVEAAQSFDPDTWAAAVQLRSPAADLQLRIHIASAHRAATCIYLSRALFQGDQGIKSSQNLENLMLEVKTHLSFILPSDAMFAATAWPAFIVGAEARDAPEKEWAITHFDRLGDSAMGTDQGGPKGSRADMGESGTNEGAPGTELGGVHEG